MGFGYAQEAFLEAGMFNLLRANTLAFTGEWVSIKRNVLTHCSLSLALYLHVVWEQLAKRTCSLPSSPSTWLISKAGPRPSGRSHEVLGPCSFPGLSNAPHSTFSCHPQAQPQRIQHTKDMKRVCGPIPTCPVNN